MIRKGVILRVSTGALFLLASAALSSSIGSAAAGRTIQEDPTPAGDVTAGEATYSSYGCYACHGYSGQNGPGARLVGSPRMSNLAGFVAYVRNPSRMPAYSTEVISERQLTDVYAFIRTLESSPEASDIPLLEELIDEQ